MERLRSSIAALMCLIIAAPSTTIAQPAPQSAAPAARPAYKSNQMQGDERIQHALNRFTFGPRPDDLESVRAAGVDQWFEAQLHPAHLNHADLNARLAQYPAMQWSAEDLLFRLPTDAVVRQAMDGKAAFPERGALHAVYANQLTRYQMRREEKEKKQQIAAAPAHGTGAGMNGSALAKNMPPAVAANQAIDESGQANAPIEPAAALPAVSDAEIAGVLALPPAQRVARLVVMKEPDLDSFRKGLKPAQRIALTADLSPELKETVAALENPQRLVVEELTAQRLTRDIYSNAQLEEVMTDFWLNHFNVFLRKNGETPYYLVSYERDVIRPRALGKFEDLLEATAHSPAMLLYLDNASSTGPDSPAAEKAAARGAQKARTGLNENYARELMELHTLGVNGGYTQADVTQVARVFTGWTVDRPQRGGGFRFDENRHEPGAKKVLGKKIKEHGELEGRQVLHMLASSPATAHFISRKLAIRFVSDNPPQALVDRLAKSYMNSGGDIAAVLRTLFHSPEFWSADDYRAKVKTPIEFVASAVRACGCDVTDYQPLTNALQGMGMPLYGAVPPTGYNWQASTWVSTGALVNRMNFALALTANHLNGVAASWTGSGSTSQTTPAVLTLAEPQAGREPDASPESEERRLEAMLVPGGVSESTRSAVLQQFAAQSGQIAAQPNPTPRKPIQPVPSIQERQDQLLAGLLLGSPEFQRR